MKDSTCYAMKLHAESAHGGTKLPAVPGKPHDPDDDPEHADDDMLAGLLIRMWSLVTGRVLRQDVPPDQLSEDELLWFWDDHPVPASGRHAARSAAKSAALFGELASMFTRQQ